MPQWRQRRFQKSGKTFQDSGKLKLHHDRHNNNSLLNHAKYEIFQLRQKASDLSGAFFCSFPGNWKMTARDATPAESQVFAKQGYSKIGRALAPVLLIICCCNRVALWPSSYADRTKSKVIYKCYKVKGWTRRVSCRWQISWYI